jgi:hypothetical protein
MVLIPLPWLCRGGGTILALSRFDLEPFLGCVQNHRVKYTSLAPPIMLALAKHPLVDKYDLSSLEWISSGATPMGGEVEGARATRPLPTAGPSGSDRLARDRPFAVAHETADGRLRPGSAKLPRATVSYWDHDVLDTRHSLRIIAALKEVG